MAETAVGGEGAGMLGTGLTKDAKNRHKAFLKFFVTDRGELENDFLFKSFKVTDEIFTKPPQELYKCICPNDIYRFLTKLAFDRPTFDSKNPEHRPIHKRADTLEAYRRDVGLCLGYGNEDYKKDPRTGAVSGSPAFSHVIRNLIKKMKDFQDRDEGAESKETRAFEFEEVLACLQLNEELEEKEKGTATEDEQAQRISIRGV
uniref:Uncharacterized protein n=1 Tax=Chromera velia CCMP2878 TaxID=1169474 RepID=A0A0G4FPS1_9ALVE|eukprot:Cvel_3608.t1-p1 / transcript=Cvel_3608.t1 / gene=Cvel_3608 / organism=Chromera_velia_CCMP2878 / gene_product=hypothetical protein / transcript_product=hypothetical protein / location=Cvel_scaffold148:28774-29753(+) / protein_length=202 / sequence_SO=supercontig / SO=protein_coding / is_pseudo=false